MQPDLMNRPDLVAARLMREVNDRVVNDLFHKRQFGFNAYFEQPDMISMYIRHRCRSVPCTVWNSGLKGNDIVEREVSYGAVRLPTLELASISVAPDYQRQKLASFLINKLIETAGYHKLYFMVENVNSPVLRSHLAKHRELWWEDWTVDGPSMYRVYEQPERTYETGIRWRMLTEVDDLV